jgi:hypothetical protein
VPLREEPSTITGAIASIAPRARRAHCVCSTEMKLYMATVTGRTRLPPSTTANRNSFHALRNTKIVVTAMPPRTCGRITYHSARSRPARSSSAASSISRGMSSKYDTMQPDRERQRERQVDDVEPRTCRARRLLQHEVVRNDEPTGGSICVAST